MKKYRICNFRAKYVLLLRAGSICVAAVCINNYFFNADFAFIFITDTCYTNPADTNDTHLQIVLIIADAPEC